MNQPTTYGLGVASGIGLTCLLALGLTGCRSTSGSAGLDLEDYRAAVVESAEGANAFEAGSDAETTALQGFNEFYAEYSVSSITSGVRSLYATDAYFGDPFKSVRGIDEIEAYFVRMAEPVESCTFDIEGMDRSSDGSYYIRWTMHLTVKSAPKRPIEALGMSHVRFNPEGKVVFQQDYWDSSALLRELPYVGWWVRLVMNRLD